MERRTGTRPPDLDGPDLPPDAEHIWLWFLDLNAARGGGFGGPNPITYEAMQAWIALTGIIVRPSEIQALRAVDEVWLAEPERPIGLG